MGVSSTFFDILTFEARKCLVFPALPCLMPPLGEPIRISDETYRTNTRGIGLLYDDNFIILTSTVMTDPPL